jgi:hypothetical protein
VKFPPSFMRLRRSKASPCQICGLPLPLDRDGYLNLWEHECFKERVSLDDVLRVFPCARVVSVSESPADEIPEADHRAILEEASHWTALGDTYRWLGAKPVVGPLRCQHCKDNSHAKVVRRTWSEIEWDWCCHTCGRTVK